MPGSAEASSVLFLATHRVDNATAERLLHHARDLARLPPASRVRPWVLLFAEPGADTGHLLPLLDVDVFRWSLDELFELFPRLADTWRASRGVRLTEEVYLKHYYLFHAGLALWWKHHGHAYPRLQHMWRIEPDVHLSGGGGWASLLMQSSRHRADVLLPMVTTEADTDEHYVHWENNRGWVKSVAPERRVWSLVCVGRFSLHFLLSIMWPQWSEGRLVYEEIFLPTSCHAHQNCTLADNFGGLADAQRIRFRPIWSCEELRLHLRESTSWPTFWHPVKDQSCIAKMLQREERATGWATSVMQRPIEPDAWHADAIDRDGRKRFSFTVPLPKRLRLFGGHTVTTTRPTPPSRRGVKAPTVQRRAQRPHS